MVKLGSIAFLFSKVGPFSFFSFVPFALFSFLFFALSFPVLESLSNFGHNVGDRTGLTIKAVDLELWEHQIPIPNHPVIKQSTTYKSDCNGSCYPFTYRSRSRGSSEGPPSEVPPLGGLAWKVSFPLSPIIIISFGNQPHFLFLSGIAACPADWTRRDTWSSVYIRRGRRRM